MVNVILERLDKLIVEEIYVVNNGEERAMEISKAPKKTMSKNALRTKRLKISRLGISNVSRPMK